MMATTPAGEVVTSDTIQMSSREPLPAARLVRFSHREQQIVRFIVDGCSNQDIARRLDLRLQTVKNHLSRIYRRLGVPNRVQLAVLAVGQGIGGPQAQPTEPGPGQRS